MLYLTRMYRGGGPGEVTELFTGALRETVRFEFCQRCSLQTDIFD